MNNLLKKKTTLLLTLCMIIGMTGLPITAYAEGLVSGAADKAAPEIGFSVTDSVYGATELKEEKLPMLFSPMSAVEWEGDGDADSPYQVSSAEHLADIPNQGLDKYYIQTANIYLTEAGYTDWTPLGTYAAPFTAKYDGDGYVIRGLTVTGSNNNASLLGFVSGGAVIENIHIRDANVTGGLNVGILVGIISDGGGATGGATIRNCSTGGMVSGTARVGGMIGAVQHDDAVIRESFSTADVAADPANSSQRGAAGGLAGFVLSGLVENCYASGQVTAGRYTGGFAGEMQGGTARYCYANVPVAGTNPGGFLGYKQGSPTITSCFFDSDSAGTTSSAAGTVKRATEMKQQGTFSDWDFTCIWSISEDAFYPVLRYYDSKWTPDERIAGDLSAISWGLIRDENTNQTAVIVDLNLPLSGGLGSTIAWSADIEGIINTETGAVTRPADHDQIVVLTATVSYAGGTSRSKTFTLIVISGAFAWGGSGSEADPYQVSSAAHLDDLRNLMGPGVHFIQTENIDLTGINWTPIGINTPDSAQFTGTYDGNNKTISNMTIDSDAIQYIGLFGYVGSGGTLENITLENISINSSRSSARVGGLTGQNRGGTIKDSCVSGSITATGESARTGGLIGDSYLGGTIENSRTSCTVTGGEGVINTIGGLVGRQQGGSIRNSYSTGNATGTYYVGGLVGYLLGSGTIEYCYSTGNVTVTGTPYSGDIGGLVGCANDGTITNCCSTGNVSGEPDLTGSYFAGGLVGSVYDVNITDSYSTGSVTLSCGDSDTNQGGFIGYVGSSSVTLENCYSTGNVTNLNLSDGSLGGFIGSKSNYTPTITSCYYLDTAAGASAGGEPLTDAELKQWESFVGWDFGGIWLVEEGHDTPVLSWQVDFAGGDGSADAPYQIETALQLNKVRGYLGDSNIHFEQKNDITLPNVAAGESNWAPIGTDLTPFTGTYDGGGYSISNLTINNSTIQCVGLFGSVGTGGTLENIRLTGVNISSITWGAYVGGVTGVNQGTVINSSSEGSVSGGDSANVGGLIGNGGGVITYNYSAANVTGGNNANVGGLLGRSYVSTSDNYSTGTITGGDNARVGGLIGDVDDGTVTNSYSTGSASGGTGASSGGLIGGGNATVNDSYYLDTAGTSAGGAPLTAAQMKQWESFEGWNFDSVWKIGQNISYPTLQWQTWTADEEITAAVAALAWTDIQGTNSAENDVTSALVLITSGGRDTVISWSADPTGYINTSNGTLSKPYTDEVIVTLTATVSKGSGIPQTKPFSLTIKSLTPDEAITLDKNALTWADIKGTNSAENNVMTALILPSTGTSGTTTITWSVDPAGNIEIDSGIGTVTRPERSQGDKTVTLTATISRDGGTSQTKDFILTVKAEPPTSDSGGDDSSSSSPPPANTDPQTAVITSDAINKETRMTPEGKTVEIFTVQSTTASQIQQAKQEGKASVEFSIASSPTAITDISIPSAVLESTAGLNVAISTPNATLELPAALVNALAAAGKDLSISVSRGEEIEDPEGGTVLGTPTEIISDIVGTTQVTIPFAGISVPDDPGERTAFLASLAVFTYHSDGETEVINGEIIYDTNGNPVSITFPVDKFSTFAVVKLNKRTVALTPGSPAASLNGLTVTLDAPAFIEPKSNRTLAPLRFVGEALGAKVEWDPAARQVTVRDGDKVIILTLDSQLALLDGQSTRIDCAPVIVPPGRTFVPCALSVRRWARKWRMTEPRRGSLLPGSMERNKSAWNSLARKTAPSSLMNSGGTVTNCSVSGVVYSSRGTGFMGGLIGWNERTVIGCGSSCSVTANTDEFSYVGGLIGETYYGGGILNCYSTGNVSGTRYAGGLIGTIEDEDISNSYSTGDVTLSGSLVAFAGGLIGYISAPHNDNAITNCYSSGSVTLSQSNPSARLGGFIGDVDSTGQTTITNCYSTGNVNGRDAAYIGGFIGKKIVDISISNSYYLDTAADASAGGDPLTGAEMKQQESFVGWDFDVTWRIINGYTNPLLQWQELTADERIITDWLALDWDDIKGANSAENNVTVDLVLPSTGTSGTTTITWSVDPAGNINLTNGKVTRPSYSQGDKTVTLTATISRDGGTSQTKDFTLTVKAQPSTGGDSDSGDLYTLQPAATQNISAASGGEVSHEGVKVTIPAGTLPQDATVSITKLTEAQAVNSVPAGLQVKLGSDIYEITTTGERNFGDNTLTIQIPFDPDKIGTGELPVIHYRDEATGEWLELPTTLEQDPVSGQWYAVTHVNHLTKFAVISTKKKQITLVIGQENASINGDFYFLDAAPYLDSKANRTLAPLRFIGEALGAKVDWDPATRQVTVSDGGKILLLTLDSATVYINGQAVTIDCAPLSPCHWAGPSSPCALSARIWALRWSMMPSPRNQDCEVMRQTVSNQSNRPPGLPNNELSSVK